MKRISAAVSLDASRALMTHASQPLENMGRAKVLYISLIWFPSVLMWVLKPYLWCLLCFFNDIIILWKYALI